MKIELSDDVWSRKQIGVECIAAIKMHCHCSLDITHRSHRSHDEIPKLKWPILSCSMLFHTQFSLRFHPVRCKDFCTMNIRACIKRRRKTFDLIQKKWTIPKRKCSAGQPVFQPAIFQLIIFLSFNVVRLFEFFFIQPKKKVVRALVK